MVPRSSDDSRLSSKMFWKDTRQDIRKGSDESSTTTATPPSKDTILEHGRKTSKRVVVSSESPENNTSSSASPSKPRKDLTTSEKAKLRRAQVRRAQIQHRQRKAEHIKQLEFDVNHFRELIQLTEIEADELRKDNDTIKAKLMGLGIPIPDASTTLEATETKPSGVITDAWIDQAAGLGTGAPQTEDAEAMYQDVPTQEELFADINIDDIIISLRKDDTVNTPIFSIRPNPEITTTGPLVLSADAGLSQIEEHMAINFILSLERICWDHFFLGDYPSHSHHSDESKGHTLMASTICMAHAPQHVYMGRTLISTTSKCRSRRTLGLDPEPPAVFFEWPSPRISLSSLHGLADSLNPGDLEVTPVQAWFELASRYPKQVLLNPAKLGMLQRELDGVVDCLDFGAVLERQAFESVVERILGNGLEDALASTSLEQMDVTYDLEPTTYLTEQGATNTSMNKV